jgi:undecaprenyl-diphosphatase
MRRDSSAAPAGGRRHQQDALRLDHAVALGLLQGPAELLPISSSGHIALVPWLLGWPHADLDPELRKSFEVALHAGTAAALLIVLRREVVDTVRSLDGRRAALLGLSFAPPAVVGFALERPIERHLGTPGSTAAGLLAGSAAMALADRRDAHRQKDDAGALDGLAMGVAQAVSLVPGISRNGATLAAARARGFDRAAANALSRRVALPVIVGASALKAQRLAQRGIPTGVGRALAAGAGAAFVSTLASSWLIGQVERDRSLLPYALYRVALAAVVIRRLSDNAPMTGHAAPAATRRRDWRGARA